jgi:hypothetical protein
MDGLQYRHAGAITDERKAEYYLGVSRNVKSVSRYIAIHDNRITILYILQLGLCIGRKNSI